MVQTTPAAVVLSAVAVGIALFGFGILVVSVMGLWGLETPSEAQTPTGALERRTHAEHLRQVEGLGTLGFGVLLLALVLAVVAPRLGGRLVKARPNE